MLDPSEFTVAVEVGEGDRIVDVHHGLLEGRLNHIGSSGVKSRTRTRAHICVRNCPCMT